MKTNSLAPARTGLLLVAALALASAGPLWPKDGPPPAPAPSLEVHPQVFSLVQGWISDAEHPVVTEFNLGAVERNGNQFFREELKQEAGWTVCPAADGRGFKRHRWLPAPPGRYQVEYQENGGGSLTTSALIEFSVQQREIRRDGRPTTLRVLRVESYSQR